MASGDAAPRRPAVFGPETWAEVAGGTWSHWDLWLAAVAVADHDGSLERLVDELYARRPAYGSTEDAEAKSSHVDDLARRLADDGLTPSDLVAHAGSDKTLLRKARRKVLDQALGRRDLTQPMQHTPRMLLQARARRGWWDGFPVSPAGADRLFCREVRRREYYGERASFGLVDRLDKLLDRQEAAATGDAGRLAALRAMLTAGLEAIERTDDSFGVLGDFLGEVLASYVKVPWAPTGMAPDAYYADLCDWLVWEDYGLTLEHETVPYARVRKAHVELVEGLLLDREAELRRHRLAYYADEAAVQVAWLHAATKSLERGVATAQRLGSQHWGPIVALAETAVARGRHDLALAIFAAADQPGRHRGHLRQRLLDLLGEPPPATASA
ncbi:MAG: hypothetical protein ACRDYA_08370 [Egibacteraceae bacterium]